MLTVISKYSQPSNGWVRAAYHSPPNQISNLAKRNIYPLHLYFIRCFFCCQRNFQYFFDINIRLARMPSSQVFMVFNFQSIRTIESIFFAPVP